METDKIKCIECGKSIPDVPEDASYEEHLCEGCYVEYEYEIEAEYLRDYKRCGWRW